MWWSKWKAYLMIENLIFPPSSWATPHFPKVTLPLSLLDNFLEAELEPKKKKKKHKMKRVKMHGSAKIY